VRLAEDALRVAEAFGAPGALGAALARVDREAAARDVLGRAWGEATVCGAAALRAIVAADLEAVGGAPDPATATGPGALTTLERRVAELASAGGDVLAIAQAAFLTPHDVEVQLEGLRRKLGGASPGARVTALAA
jgi:DNA-binding NarL/FixJ family response regulator